MIESEQAPDAAEPRPSMPDDLRRRDAFDRVRASRASALLEDDVEGMEHFVSEPTLRAVEAFLASSPSKP